MAKMANILIVDDERDLVQVLEFNLRQAGYETQSAYEGDQAHRAFVDGHAVELPALELKLLRRFLSRLGRVQTRDTLLQDMWELSSEVQTRTVDAHVKRLHEKLGSGRDLVETVRGVGYRMADPAEKV